MAQLRYQQRYLERLRQDQYRLQNWQYSYAPPQYRYYRGGRYYEANQYAADLLRQAVRTGYEEGVRAGQSDREDRWQNRYQDSFGYEDASVGYDGYYVDLPEYQYYFREGFRRGYEDGYNGQYRYGTYSNGVFSLLGNVLGAILDLQPYRY
jgi:flagellar biosynthesis/type III secretory pathway protein FliH